MIKHSNSSDQDQAIALAGKLSKNRKTLKKPGKQTTSSPATSAGVNSLEMAPVPKIGFQDRDVYRDQVWAVLLSWAIQTSGCRSAFVCDGTGLIIAESGKLPQNWKKIPSFSILALDRLRGCTAVGNAPKILSAKLDNNWVTLLNLTHKDVITSHDSLALGLFGLAVPESQVLAYIHYTFRSKISDLKPY